MNPWLACRNLLVVRLDNAGDVVMLGPALRAVRNTTPEATITLLATRAGAAVAPLLPEIDDVIVWRPIWQELGQAAVDPAREGELIRLLSERRFDGALIFSSFRQTPHVPGYVCYLAGIPLRAGESKEFGGATLTHELPSAPDDVHQVERNLGFVERLGFWAKDRDVRLMLSPGDHERADELLRDVGIDPIARFAIVHPGASAPARRYPAHRYAEVVTGLQSRGLPVVITGTERETSLTDGLSAATGAPSVAGKLGIGEFAAAIERASVVVCGNTLPMHIADACATPVVALYAGTDLESQWGPRRSSHALLRRETACHPCYLIDCPIGQPCLAIDPRNVLDEAVRRTAADRAPGTGARDRTGAGR